jgi:hypothetical protein
MRPASLSEGGQSVLTAACVCNIFIENLLVKWRASAIFRGIEALWPPKL